MTSIVLSKNTLRKVFGSGLSSDDCQHVSDYPERPKTTVPWKRRPLSDATPKRKDKNMTLNNNSSSEMNNDVCRPKTSYSNRKLSENKQMCPSESSKGKPGGNNVKLLTEKDLEDIDIVEYFNDKSIRDILPVSYFHDVNNESHMSKPKYQTSQFDQSYGCVNQINQNIETTNRKCSRIKRDQIQKNMVLNSGDGPFDKIYETTAMKSKSMTNVPFENKHDPKVYGKRRDTKSFENRHDKKPLENDTHNFQQKHDILSFCQRKSSGLKEKTDGKLESRRRLHSDTEEASSVERTIDSRVRTPAKPKMTTIPTQHQIRSISSNSDLQSPIQSGNQNINMRSKIITKYKHDMRINDHPTAFSDLSKHQSEYSFRINESFQYKTNKYPRKLKPISGSNNQASIQK